MAERISKVTGSFWYKMVSTMLTIACIWTLQFLLPSVTLGNITGWLPLVGDYSVQAVTAIAILVGSTTLVGAESFYFGIKRLVLYYIKHDSNKYLVLQGAVCVMLGTAVITAALCFLKDLPSLAVLNL